MIKYGSAKKQALSFENAVLTIPLELKKEGFNILTEINTFQIQQS